ncbi:MAG: hypothetical protein K9N48_09305 [Verrucomicrobia bacterium]|nr:hypothetical protein [Verrucomicrobiota bacterium]
MNYRFYLFSLRDKLGRLACEGKLDENGEIYDFFIFSLNTAIKHLETVDLFAFTMWRWEVEQNTEFKKKFHRLVEQARDVCPEALDIIKDYEDTLLSVLFKNSFILKHPKLTLAILSIPLFFGSKHFRLKCIDKVKGMLSMPDIVRKRLGKVGITI